MNKLKKKVFASAAMLLVAAIMMTSSSFAWYTISTQGVAEEIKVEMTSTTNLEIAKADKGTSADNMNAVEVNLGDSGDQHKWGGKISFSTATSSVEFPSVVATGSDAAVCDFKTIEYDSDGRVKLELQKLTVASSPSELDDGVGSYKAWIKSVSSDTDQTDKYDIASVFGVWLRSNVAAELQAQITGTPVVKVKGTEETIDGAKVQVGVKVGDEEIKAINDTATDLDYTLNPDVPTSAWIYVSVDGDKILAQHIDNGVEVTGLNVTFSDKSGKVEGIERIQ